MIYKIIIKYILVVFFLFAASDNNNATANGMESISYLSDSTNVSFNKDSTCNRIGFYLFGGFGISGAPAFDDNINVHKTGPAINMGIELPLSASYKSSFELTGSFWVTKSKSKLDDTEKSYFIDFGNDTHSLMWLSTVFKWYISVINDNIRISFRTGYLLFCSNSSLYGPEIGLALNYQLNEHNFINISYNTYIIPLFWSLKNFGYMPSLIMLNYFHKFQW